MTPLGILARLAIPPPEIAMAYAVAAVAHVLARRRPAPDEVNEHHGGAVAFRALLRGCQASCPVGVGCKGCPG